VAVIHLHNGEHAIKYNIIDKAKHRFLIIFLQNDNIPLNTNNMKVFGGDLDINIKYTYT
jgi:hypothetical protein